MHLPAAPDESHLVNSVQVVGQMQGKQSGNCEFCFFNTLNPRPYRGVGATPPEVFRG